MTLIERLEAASGPDRELDAEIAVAIDGGEIVWLTAKYTMESCPARKYASGNHIVGYGKAPIPAYTASIDAALTLVPEGWSYAGTQGPSGAPHIWTLLSTIKSEDVRYTTVTGRARSAAPALCIAALRAREADRG